MNYTVNISALSVFVFLGVFQGFLLSLLLIFKNTPNREANRFQGLLLLTLSVCILEQFLNMTGLIVRVLHVTNTTEPLNLIIGPLLFLYVKFSIDRRRTGYEWVHFVLAGLYFLYMWFDYLQPPEIKYNSYIASYHPDWNILDVTTSIPDDPLNIKKHLNLVTAVQLLFYIFLSLVKILKKGGLSFISLFRLEDDVLCLLRNMVLHILAILVIFVGVKLSFQGDLGDYFIGIYVSVFTLVTSVRVMNDSSYFDKTASFMDIPVSKYVKSSLNESRKEAITTGILIEFEKKQYYTDNLASLSDLAKKLGESPHHVSQVINEKLGKNFFELLASYRIEKAKSLLQDKSSKITIEEISEKVGYNSKTAFNNAFRKLTGKTPAEFRKSANI
jgi:AraC-like DNA-binding protein